MNRVLCLLRKERENAAMNLIRQAIQLRPNTPYIRANLELIKTLMPVMYRDDLAELIHDAPVNPGNHQVYGLAFLSRRQPDQIEYTDTTCLICDGKKILTCPDCHGKGKKNKKSNR